MKESGRANALLVELLLVIFFFMISAAILVQVYADAKLKSFVPSIEGKILKAEVEATDGTKSTIRMQLRAGGAEE